jgi:hypothetical protein
MIEEIPISEANVFGIRVSGRLTLADYQAFLPMLDKLIEDRGKISLLIELRDFRGWEMKAAHEDYRFGTAHQEDFERIAIVGDKAWQRWMTALSTPFVSSEIRYFSQDEKDEAGSGCRLRPKRSPAYPPHAPISTSWSPPISPNPPAMRPSGPGRYQNTTMPISA